MRIFKLDDGLVVRLPELLVETMGLQDGDELAIVEYSKEKVVVEKVDRRARFLKDMEQFRWPDVIESTPVVDKEDRRKAALERIAARNWTLPPDYKFDRDEANAR